MTTRIGANTAFVATRLGANTVFMATSLGANTAFMATRLGEGSHWGLMIKGLEMELYQTHIQVMHSVCPQS